MGSQRNVRTDRPEKGGKKKMKEKKTKNGQPEECENRPTAHVSAYATWMPWSSKNIVSIIPLPSAAIAISRQ